MPATLKQLSDNEIQILNKVIEQYNTGAKLVDIPNEWLFKDYESIHNEYLNIYKLLIGENIKFEALKRLIFLNWYGIVEPPHLTGIDNLSEETIFNSYKILNSYIKDGKLDDELKWMLSFYSCWDFSILHYSENKLDYLTSFVNCVDQSIQHRPESLEQGQMDDRGQMGDYWKSYYK